MSPVKPISPVEVVLAKAKTIPDDVIEVFNQLIAKNYLHGKSTITQEEVLDCLWTDKEISRQEVFKQHWLDVEDLYRAEGWTVEYDKAGYNEDYESTFTFSR